MRKFYVWSGSLKGVEVEAERTFDAVDIAVRENLPCVLSTAIRVSVRPQGAHPLDVFYEPPYEDLFPDLFDDDSLEVHVARVEPL